MLKNPIIKNLLLAGGTAILIIVLVLWFLRVYTNHGEKIETPNFNGLTIADGKDLAKDKGLTLVIDTVFNSGAPKGTIFLQNPSAHTDSSVSWVKSGRKIYVTAVRNSVQLLPFPNIDASELIVIPRLSGRFKIKKEFEQGPSGKVLYAKYKGKKVKEGDMIPRNAKIILAVGEAKKKEAVSLPNLVGLTVREANLKLTDKGLALLDIYNNCATKLDSTNGKIIEQSPNYNEGAQIMQGTDIVVTIKCVNQ